MSKETNVLASVDEAIERGAYYLEQGDVELAVEKLFEAKALVENILTVMLAQGYKFPLNTLFRLYHVEAMIIRANVHLHKAGTLDSLQNLLLDIIDVAKVTHSGELFNAIWQPLSLFALECRKKGSYERFFQLAADVNEIICLVDNISQPEVDKHFKHSIVLLSENEEHFSNELDYISSMYTALGKVGGNKGIDSEEIEDHLFQMLAQHSQVLDTFLSVGDFSGYKRFCHKLIGAFTSAFEAFPRKDLLVALNNLCQKMWHPCIRLGRLDLALEYLKEGVQFSEQSFHEFEDHDALQDIQSLKNGRQKFLAGAGCVDVLDELNDIIKSMSDAPTEPR